MRMHRLAVPFAAAVLVVSAGGLPLARPALAGPPAPPATLPDDVPLGIEPSDMTPEQQRALAAYNRDRLVCEKQLKTLRTQYFLNIANPARRAAGLQELAKFNRPEAYPLLLTIFEDDGRDVRGRILDLLLDAKSHPADASLAWAAMWSRDEWFRSEAKVRLLQRIQSEGGVAPREVRSAVALGLQSVNDPQMHIHAAQLAQDLGLVEAIPAIIMAQVGGGQAPGGSGRSGNDGYLATIVIGRQVSFISDLTPVVGDSAVGFDPQVSVITEGVVMNIRDAVVTWHNVALHNQLVSWTSRLGGTNTAALGYDRGAWARWYAHEFAPMMERQAALKDALKAEFDTLEISRTPAGPAL